MTTAKRQKRKQMKFGNGRATVCGRYWWVVNSDGTTFKDGTAKTSAQAIRQAHIALAESTDAD